MQLRNIFASWRNLSRPCAPPLIKVFLVLFLQKKNILPILCCLALPAAAEQRVVIHDGEMCQSPEALAKLTLPNGSARDDPGTIMSGKCRNLVIGAVLDLESVRKRTSVAIVAGNRYIVPNIDLGPLAAAACVSADSITSVTGKIEQKTFQSEDHGARRYWQITLGKPLCIKTETNGTEMINAAEIDARATPNALVAGQQRTLSGTLEENQVGEHPTDATFVLGPRR
jgi:hypothetical protein